MARICPIRSGATLTFKWQSWPADPSKEVIDRGHHGPCAVYMKKVNSAKDDPGHGGGWFKIWDDGYDADKDYWCTDRLIDAGGYMTVKIPQGLRGGHYLVRPELLALHAAGDGNPQFYTGCAQVFIKDGGDLVPNHTVRIPGYVAPTDKSVDLNIWGRMELPYVKPGPQVATLKHGSPTTQRELKQGLRPEGCIAINGDWCGFEVPSYTTEHGCWEASKDCWRQADLCWGAAPPTGAEGCKKWSDKCQDLVDHCHSGAWNGPPNKGKSLIPKPLKIAIPPPLGPTVGGGQPAPTPVDKAQSTEKATTEGKIGDGSSSCVEEGGTKTVTVTVTATSYLQ